MLRGYFLTSIVWPMTTAFRDFSHDEHATTFEYLAWCRDHLLVFARCEILEYRALVLLSIDGPSL
jgi:hypothetical protein